VDVTKGRAPLSRFTHSAGACLPWHHLRFHKQTESHLLTHPAKAAAENFEREEVEEEAVAERKREPLLQTAFVDFLPLYFVRKQ
jgi:hypothetical protein